MHPKGFGFVTPDNPTPDSSKDIFIPRNAVQNAVDGDRVEIEINPNSDWEKGPDGKVVAVLQRGRTMLAGIILELGPPVFAHVPILGPDKPIIVNLQPDETVEVGERYLFTVIKWGDKTQETVCSLSRKIGDIEDPSCDIQAAIAEYDLPSAFPAAAVQEAEKLGDEVTKKQMEGRFDLSKTITFTIDPETAKDYDDALSISKDEKGHFFLGVHIADVAFYVPSGGALDQEAALRSNSTYLPGTCIPMLPEALSNNLCSLRQGVFRLCVSVLMEFRPDGTVQDAQIKRTFIKSKKRFTYGEAKEVLDGTQTSPHAQALTEMVELCHLLKAKRSERGSIDFALPELIIHINEKGEPTGTRIEEYHITHQLVEEFMLKANEMVAKELDNRGKTQLFRIHEEPTSENMEEFFANARALGFHLPPKPTKEDLQNLFEQAKKTPFNQQLSVGFIRTLKIAYYSPRNVGHYGLALEHYCHFTSPIRRYSDLITQRLLFDEEAKNSNFEKIAKRCSEQERLSFRAEVSVKTLKKLRLLRHWNEENPDRNFPAFITRIKPFGFAFEIRELFIEGFLHVSNLEEDYFHYLPATEILQGERTGRRYKVGDSIEVYPLAIDFIYLETEWALHLPPKIKKQE